MVTKPKPTLADKLEAINECRDHLDQDWHMNPEERAAGAWLKDRLDTLAKRLTVQGARKRKAVK